MTRSRTALRAGAALLALALLAGLLALPAAHPVKATADASADAALCFLDGAVPAEANASARDSTESRLDAAERTVALRLRRETPPTLRTEEPRPAPTPTGRTTERAQSADASDEPG